MNRKIKTLAPYGVGLLAIIGVLAAPQAAQAHDGGVTATCTSLSANLSNYPAGSTIGGTLDGVDLGTSTFGPSFSQTATLDPAVPHTWSIRVTSGDGDPRYSFTSAGSSDPSCIPVVEEPPVVTPPVEPPVVVPPVEPPVIVTPPVEPPVVTPPVVTPPVVTPVIAPLVQSYCMTRGSAFVLDNTGSTVDVTYIVSADTTRTYLVPAGRTLHTDADGTVFRPKVGDVLTITAADRVWTSVGTLGCFPTEEPPVIVPPVVTPPTEEPPVVEPPTEEPTTPVTPPVDEPTTPATPVTPEAPVAEVTPAPVAPTLVAALEDDAPLQITAVDDAPAADGSLAYTGTDIRGTWIMTLSALGVALVGLLFVIVARARRGVHRAREVADIVTNRSRR